MKTEKIDTCDLVLTYGRHKGVRIRRVPVNYLLWIKRNKAAQWEDAEAELERRGTVIPQIQLSGHSIDTASLRIRWCWHEHSGKGEGLHAWLCRTAWDAYNARADKKDEEVEHLGVVWCFETDGGWPILKTVKPANKRKK